VSWIHRDDLVELYVFALENAATTSALNATAPTPVTMKEFATTLGKVLHRPSFAAVPAPVLKLLLGGMSMVVLDGQRVLPSRALSLGFAFRYGALEPALSSATGA